VAELDGGAKGVPWGEGPIKVVRASSGEFVAIGWEGDLLRFSPKGKYLGLIGRKGEGPGEYRYPSMMGIDRQGNIQIIDHQLGRRTVYSPAGKFLRSSAFPDDFRGSDLHFTATGEVITAGSSRLPEHFGYPFLRSAGSKLGPSFGPRKKLDPRSGDGPDPYFLTSAKAGGFWAVRKLGLDLTLWRDDATPARRFLYAPAWFPPRQEFGKVGPADPIQPMVRGIAERTDGLLAIEVSVAGTRWKEAWGQPEATPFRMPGDPATQQRIKRYDDAYAVRVLIVDPSSASVLIDQRFDHHMMGFADPTHLVGFTVVDDEPVVKIWELTLKRAGSR
jgi:hypothetical protein